MRGGNHHGQPQEHVGDPERDLHQRVYAMKTGEVINYWQGIADAYDFATPDGVREDIREAYDEAIDDLIEHGHLEPVIDGDGVTTGYARLKK